MQPPCALAPGLLNRKPRIGEKVGWGRFAGGSALLSAELHRENREATAGESYGRFLYNWNRMYDPATGRYISADPLDQAVSTNVYEYAYNDPINFFDPDGLEPHRKRRGSKNKTRDKHTKPRPGDPEKGDARRRPPRQRPPDHRGPWPPQPDPPPSGAPDSSPDGVDPTANFTPVPTNDGVSAFTRFCADNPNVCAAAGAAAATAATVGAACAATVGGFFGFGT